MTDAMRAHPAWLSWTLLVDLFGLCVQHKLSLKDVERLDDLQLEYHAAFDQVPEYAGLKRPKHHFLAHLCQDVWRYGPPRGYWCFGFEGFNRVIKSGARTGNWSNAPVCIMRYWSMRSARVLVEKRRRDVLSRSTVVVRV